MGKPRMIILVRHGQSEGNKNRDIHQLIPDHRVKLTSEGQSQAEEAGRRLRSMLKPDDTLQFFTSPYRRTRETAEGILRTLTSDDPAPSPFPRSQIKVYEEPRLREQDFGNFQPCSAEMERMWQERADYGHFFYRIPNGESAADAYDRIAGFNESMWRSFGEDDFPSVCVLVTHGLMTRVFLMKWYHWSVEYFEDLRNIRHCEFIVMEKNKGNGKYDLQNNLRTWSELKNRMSIQTNGAATTHNAPPPPGVSDSPTMPARKWGGCANGCDHGKIHFPRRTRRQNTHDFLVTASENSRKDGNHGRDHHPKLPPAAIQEGENEIAKEDAPLPTSATLQEATFSPSLTSEGGPSSHPFPSPFPASLRSPDSADVPYDGSSDSSTDPVARRKALGQTGLRPLPVSQAETMTKKRRAQHPSHILLNPGRDFGGSLSGAATPAAGSDDESGFFSDGTDRVALEHEGLEPKSAEESRRSLGKSVESSAQWVEQSGMGTGMRADALGDGGDEESDDEDEQILTVEEIKKREEGVRGSVY